MKRPVFLAVFSVEVLAAPAFAQTHEQGICAVHHDQLAQAIKQSVKASGGPSNGGLDTNEWVAIVDRNGAVCAVAFSGANLTDQWPGSRAIAIEKANTANAFALDNFAISTANLWGQAQPGAPLFGLPQASPPAAPELHAGSPEHYGTAADPLVGKPVGGTVVFGGGLALYDQNHRVIGGLGASGDTSCADHNIAWRVRQMLKLDNVPGGPSPEHNDEIVYDVGPDGRSKSGWGHPQCGDNAAQVAKEIGSGQVETAPPTTTGQAPGRGGKQSGSKNKSTLPGFAR
jgi:uncharacterized protein GlcG (DUF336 family)